MKHLISTVLVFITIISFNTTAYASSVANSHVIGNDYIQFSVADVDDNVNNGRFTISRVDENTEISDNPILWPSYTTIWINDVNYIFTAEQTVYDPENLNSVSTMTVDDVLITQTIQIVSNNSTKLNNTIQISYVAQNQSNEPKNIAFRITLDTTPSDSNEMSFNVPFLGKVTTEKELAGNYIPFYWKSYNDSTNEEFAVGILYDDGDRKPDKVQFTALDSVSDFNNAWDYTPNLGKDLTNNSAVSIYWNPISIASGSSTTVSTYYSFASDTPSDLGNSVTLETIYNEVSFSDIENGSSYDAAGYAVYYGLLSTNSDGTFDPYAPITRADVVSALYRLSGEVAPTDRKIYSDVSQNSPYADAIAWASSTGVAIGTSATKFDPDAYATRSQLAVMLWRFATLRGNAVAASGNLSAYQDSSSVATYSAEAMSWALENGVFRTVVTDTLYPSMPVSRLQLAHALVALQSSVDVLAQEIQASTPAKTVSLDAPAHHSEIQAVVEKAAKKYGAVGIQVAVVENGQVSDTFAYGWATKNITPMTADSKERVASLSKTLISTCAMILREDGVIDLDSSIGDYWGFSIRNPRYPNVPITIRSILTHTSSIFSAGDDESRLYSNVKRRLMGSGFSSTYPGSLGSWNYNNYAFAVLGMTLELASNKYLETILNQRLFTAMEIDASFSSGGVKSTDQLVTLYRSDGSVARSVNYQKSLRRTGSPGSDGTFFAGGLTISSRDMGKMIALLTQDGRFEGVQMMDEESVKLMESYSQQKVSTGFYQAMPMRYQENMYGREGLYFHTGSAYGVYNAYSYDPITGDGVVVLTTGAIGYKDKYGIYSVCADISKYIYNTIK